MSGRVPEFGDVGTRRCYGYTTHAAAGRFAVRCNGDLIDYGVDDIECSAIMLRHWQSTHEFLAMCGTPSHLAALREASEMLHAIMRGGSYNALEFIERLARIDAALPREES